MDLSKSGKGSALTQVTEAKSHVTIEIPAGKGGCLKAIELQVSPVLETVVDSGGIVKLRNSSADWAPLELLSPSGTVVTEGGGIDSSPMRYAVEKSLPGNSDVYADFTPYDNQSQYLEVTLIWEVGARPVKENFSKAVYPLKAAAVSSTARASPGTIAVPGGKGGVSESIFAMAFPTLETIVNSGGLLELECDAIDITPCNFYTSYVSTVGGSGGGVIYPDVWPYNIPVPANSTFKA